MYQIILSLLLTFTMSLSKHKHSDHQKLQIDYSNFEHVHIYNTGGTVDVDAMNGNDGILQVQRKIDARTETKLENAINEIYIDTMILDNELFIYVHSPYQELTNRYSDHFQYEGKGKFRHWNADKVGVTYSFDLTLSLPSNMPATISTHKGDIQIKGLKGELSAMNHFDDVLLKNVQNVIYAHSHHGDVEVEYSGSLSEDLVLDTHHGDITLKFENTPSADIEFESYHGSLYTEFDWEPGKVLVEESDDDHKTKYKVGGKTKVIMGRGGKLISFDSHHGDFYILKS